MILNNDFKEFIKLLNDNDVRYLIVGGYAVAFHGHPRYTKDLDIWIQISDENAEKIVKTLHDFGFSSLNISKQDFLNSGDVIQLGNPPNRIDILTQATGVQFEQCYSSRIEVNIDDTLINFIDLENLKQNKKATGRFQDLADIENLE